MKQKSIRYHYNRASRIAERELVKRARRILTTHPHLDEFICGMGSTFFTLKDDPDIYIGPEDSQCMKPVANLLNEWDEHFKLTGWGIRFRATGPIIYNW